ncbi:MAG TPA: D-tagatose-bisphosphate aldolase, class II, non-catalytic subunit [Acidobacteriaceae bacterium]|nr:D-tagatose-bisphosphate aldolase, class II, non-catalytic subunit [Acidobacteriaceae bacterium]
MPDYLQSFLRSSRGTRGMYSVCSAHPWVIESAMRQAIAHDTYLLLEATCNQVNQAGGYTGMTPAMFRDYAHGIAAQLNFDASRLILGGDHLGPNPWQTLDAATAMQNALKMVRLYVEAGFTKIHLDASMRCADDPAVLPNELMAKRAATLCKTAEDARARLGPGPVVYVIGTEVPVPGGATHSLDGLEVTGCEAAEQTLAVHREAFLDAGLDAAWNRVIALVVQPGVEFDHDSVIDYDARKAAHLQGFLQAHPTLVMEAHSTDYQLPHAYEELVRDGFAILKVGPALTFALRETLYALSAIESQLVPLSERARLVETMEAVMLAHPSDWQKYYHGTAEEQRLLRVYSYSDRLRYYWKFPEVEAAVKRLVRNLEKTSVPETLLSQHCPRQYEAVRAGKLKNEPKELVIANIMAVLGAYSKACLGER